MLTQERLKELLDYNPETGVFVWNVATNGSIKLGQRAGCVGSRGYRQIGIAKVLYLEHRLAWFYMYGAWPTEIDHINRIKCDNRISNLREVSRSENNWNMPKSKHNASGFVGVHWAKRESKWVAKIKKHSKTKHIGYFNTLEEAHAAYLAAKEELHKIGEQQ